MRQIQLIDELIYAEIRERKEQLSSRSDMLSLMMSARDEAGEPMTDVEIRIGVNDYVSGGSRNHCNCPIMGIILDSPSTRGA